MLAEERQAKIEQYIVNAEFASLDELSEKVDVSVSTVRRDLAALESKGVLRRTHGGARLSNPRSDEFTFASRDTRQLAEKEVIGRACAAMIDPNQSVIIDAGTTPYHVARHLQEKSPQIITNSLPVAQLYASSPNVELVLSGGVVYPRLGVLVGPMAIESFAGMHADVAIMSAGGITLEGLTNSHTLLVEIQVAMMRAAAKVVFCLDHTKFNRSSVARLSSLDPVDAIVTDKGADSELVRQLRARELNVIIAD
jgi:DeoR family transcriptional regulator, fructose operon transcriptional repressor